METFYEKFSGYYDYFDNLRKRLYSLAIVFGVFFVVGFLEAGHIVRAIVDIFRLTDVSIVTTSPFQFLSLATNVGLYTGLIFMAPVLLYHTYDFLKDGLTSKEKKMFFVLLPIGFALFAVGFIYSFIILYFYLNSVSAINLDFGIKNMWDISSFLSQIIIASTLLGFVFEFPIILTFLIRIGMLDARALREKRLYAIAGIFIFVGFLPPPDIFSTIIQALPLIGLYQLTIWANASYGRGYEISAPIERNHRSIDVVSTSP
jgi:sec-independent protein translocase protein TatC